MRNSEYRFFLHFVRLPATFSLGYVSRHIQPAFLDLGQLSRQLLQPPVRSNTYVGET